MWGFWQVVSLCSFCFSSMFWILCIWRRKHVLKSQLSHSPWFSCAPGMRVCSEEVCKLQRAVRHMLFEPRILRSYRLRRRGG